MPYLTREWELAIQLESAFGTSPGALAGTDFFKHTSSLGFDRVVGQYYRDKDRDVNQADVITTHKGRESSKFSIACDLIPSGNAGTPTPPDIDVLLEAHQGTKHTATAHTTLTSGSTTTVLELTAGGGAASGIQVGDIIVVDVSAAFGLQARQVTVVSTDTITVDRALSAAPATGRAVYVGTTYHWLHSALKSFHLWQFLDGNNFRHSAGGCVPQNLAIDVDFAQTEPVARVTVDGIGGRKVTASTSRPTPSTAGVPLIPSEGKVWIGSALTNIVKYGLKSNNGNTLRQSEGGSLYPSGVKKTENSSRYNVTQAMDLFLETGTIEGYHDNESSLTAYDVLTQLGVSPGSIVVIRTPKYVPMAPESEIDGEVALSLSGRCYGVNGDDSLSIAFI
jgi:hypothetical protein